MASIPLPALQIRPPEDPTQGIERAVALRNLLQNAPIQRQILQQQAQTGAVNLQEQQLNLKSQQAIMRAYTEANGDPDQTVKLASKYGALPKDALSLQNNFLEQRMKTLDLVSKQGAEAKRQADLMQGAHDAVAASDNKPVAYANSLRSLSQQGVDVSQIPQQYPGDDAFKVLGVAVRSHTQMVEDALKQAQQFKEQNQGLEAQQMTANERAKFPQIQAEAAAAPTNISLEQASKRANIAKSYAEIAKTKVETENLGQQPIFAYDPATRTRVQTTRPEAKQLGYTNPVSVNEGAIAKERDASAMVNDVQLNTSRYRTAMHQLYQQPITHGQMTALTALTPEKLGIEIGHGFGISLPDVIQKVANASAFSVLTKPQKEAVLTYYSTLASVPAAQKALSGIGRSNKEMLDLELRTIPTPLMDKETFDIGLDRFQGNIDQTASKNVRIPGMPTTQEVRLQNEPEFAAQQRQGNSNNLPTISRPLSDLLNNFK